MSFSKLVLSTYGGDPDGQLSLHLHGWKVDYVILLSYPPAQGKQNKINTQKAQSIIECVCPHEQFHMLRACLILRFEKEAV